MIDDTSGMQLKEYKRFVARLPKRYKTIISSKGITFETFDTDNDGGKKMLMFCLASPQTNQNYVKDTDLH